jgi:hypothetical protein
VAPQKTVNVLTTRLTRLQIMRFENTVLDISTRTSLKTSRYPAKQLKGSGTWFLLKPESKNWSDSESDDSNFGSILACSGIPGAGKSVIWCVVNLNT